MSLFKFPSDGFQQIEAIVTKNPKLLLAGDWHTLPNGKEAFTAEEIMRPHTKHCLMGFIIKVTPKAAEYEMLREEVDEFANSILLANGHNPIPRAIIFGEEADMLRTIVLRANAERARSFHSRELTVH